MNRISRQVSIGMHIVSWSGVVALGLVLLCLTPVIVFNATFNNISAILVSWRSVLFFFSDVLDVL